MQKLPLLLFALATACSSQPASSTTPASNTPASADASQPGQAAAQDEHAHHEQAKPWTLAGLARGAKLLPDLGAVKRPITTSVPQAQTFFDQGLALTYGFNHDEAARSFAKAGELDANCAMCWWGAALTLGPNYNIPMLPERTEAAWDALGRAKKAAEKATPVEQALVGALAQRYKGPEYLDPAAMQPFNEAYAGAMKKVAKEFPKDDDVQALTAEAQMNVNPWKLWTPDGKPAPGTKEIVSTLERVLKRSPNHVGANHYYIHAIEASTKPQRAVPSADRLGGLLPGAGHLVHMPAHIYQRVGRYADASAANQHAIQSDRRYLEQVQPPGYYPIYLGHNYGFLAYSASMEGRSQESLKAARESANTIPKDVVCGMPGMDFFWSEPLLVMVRFGKWKELLAEARPDPKYHALTALWHHAHGMALAATGKPQDAKADLAAIQKLAGEIPEDLLTGLNSGQLVLQLAAKVLEARIAEASKSEQALELWKEAVEIEDQLAYNEPADWFYPVRHYYGAALLDANKAKQAEAVYRADLKDNPNNGWALFGLWKALEAQKRASEAKKAEQNFRTAWAKADFELKRTAF